MRGITEMNTHTNTIRLEIEEPPAISSTTELAETHPGPPPAADAEGTPRDDAADSGVVDGDDAGRNTSDEEENPGYDLPLDQIFEILKNERRRMVLYYLRDNDGTATLGELSEHIAAIENDTTVRAISSSQRKRVYVGLYQCHLPKMDNVDVIEFEKNRGTIEIGPNVDQLEEYLGDSEQQPWHMVYLGLALVGGVLFAASQFGGILSALTPSVVLLLLLLGIVVSVGVQFYHT